MASIPFQIPFPAITFTGDFGLNLHMKEAESAFFHNIMATMKGDFREFYTWFTKFNTLEYEGKREMETLKIKL